MFSIRYHSVFGRWFIHLDGKRWHGIGFNDEWEAIDALAETHPADARWLQAIHLSIA